MVPHRAKGQGIKKADGTTGDLYAEMQIVLPGSIDEESEALIRKLDAKLKQRDPRSDLQW